MFTADFTKTAVISFIKWSEAFRINIHFHAYRQAFKGDPTLSIGAVRPEASGATITPFLGPENCGGRVPGHGWQKSQHRAVVEVGVDMDLGTSRSRYFVAVPDPD